MEDTDDPIAITDDESVYVEPNIPRRLVSPQEYMCICADSSPHQPTCAESPRHKDSGDVYGDGGAACTPHPQTMSGHHIADIHALRIAARVSRARGAVMSRTRYGSAACMWARVRVRVRRKTWYDLPRRRNRPCAWRGAASPLR
eukprot:TRINITY_DN5439_c0_g8_i1.p2 TRINITY_DN5439_c0_g8~~TRINITY_DN5439_c0_g8_i1.p2  ORF type:complete len:144 (+),score=9.49 TRINITY_DN5439_c0_g8_i1:348-779(+)